MELSLMGNWGSRWGVRKPSLRTAEPWRMSRSWSWWGGGKSEPQQREQCGREPWVWKGTWRGTIYLVKPYWARWCWLQVRLCLKSEGGQGLVGTVRSRDFSSDTWRGCQHSLPYRIHASSHYTWFPPVKVFFLGHQWVLLLNSIDFFSCNNYLWNTVPDTGDAASWHQSTLLTDLLSYWFPWLLCFSPIS